MVFVAEVGLHGWSLWLRWVYMVFVAEVGLHRGLCG